MYQVLCIAYRSFKIFLIMAFFIHTTTLASAQIMSNKDYILQTEKFNAVSNATKDQNYKLRSIDKEPGTVASEGVNFQVRTRFTNIAATTPFSVFLSSDKVDFGMLSPTNPIVRTLDLSIYSLSTYGYSVIASENHLLQSTNANIPNATCDNGECNQKKAGAWTNTLSFGFGYRCDNVTGADCDNSFSKPNFYKHFADTSNAQSPQPAMSGIGSKNRNVRLSYKVNISGSQAEGIYTNIITYIAVPNF